VWPVYGVWPVCGGGPVYGGVAGVRGGWHISFDDVPMVCNAV